MSPSTTVTSKANVTVNIFSKVDVFSIKVREKCGLISQKSVAIMKRHLH